MTDHVSTLSRRNVLLVSRGLAVTSAFGSTAVIQATAHAQAAPVETPAAITEQEAHDIGVDAYLYFYPLLSADVTRRVSTNIEAGKGPMKGPANTLPERACLSARRPKAGC